MIHADQKIVAQGRDRTNRQNVDNVSAITSICDSSEINVETICMQIFFAEKKVRNV